MASTVNPQIAWRNLLRLNPTVVFTNSVPVAGFDPENATDWRDFTTWRITATATATVQPTTGFTADAYDTIILWVDSVTPFAASVSVQSSPDGATWSNRWAGSVNQDGESGTLCGIKWADFSSFTLSAGYLRVLIVVTSGTMNVRQMFLGAKVAVPVGQWEGLNPPLSVQGMVQENVIAVNGSIIARNVRRAEKVGTITLEHLTPAWIRSTWYDICTHAKRYPFFWRWDPVGHPAEVAFAAATEIPAPVNMMPPPLMSASLPVNFLT